MVLHENQSMDQHLCLHHSRGKIANSILACFAGLKYGQLEVIGSILGSAKKIYTDILYCLLLCRFIRNQLVVEITTNAQLARLFGWALKKHTILTFSLYTAGKYHMHQSVQLSRIFIVVLRLHDCTLKFDRLPVKGVLQGVLLILHLCSAGFVSFVLKLEKGCYMYQFGNYAWTHLILLFVFIPSSFFVSNIFDGIIWFLLPCSLVIVNDIAAYISG